MSTIPNLPEKTIDRVPNQFYLKDGTMRFWNGKMLLCEHKKRPGRCLDCNGSQVCEHKKCKEYCKDCKGTQICIHKKHKRTCKECGGSRICIHNIIKTYCKECGKFCPHGLQKHFCRECGGASLCTHGKRKSKCKQCKGSDFCVHEKWKTHCKLCGGGRLCKSSWCENTGNKKYDRYCMRCFVYLFPDKPVAKNYKVKEYAVVEYIKNEFKNMDWINDKKVVDGCSARRPDLLVDLGSQVLIIEVDENQHENYDCSCENKRLMLLSMDVNHRPIIFIRFNPDEYFINGKKISGCFGYGNNGICRVKKSKKKEWKERLECLVDRVRYWIENNSEKTIHIEQLYFDE
jgi:hypothetical protein